MSARNLFKPFYILGIVPVMLVLMLFSTPAYSANYPLEIINIRPAGTGNPAIPASNRIFRAYPGIEYNIRAAVTGGLYPFTFRLTNAPPGMTINASTGEIRWPNPQASSGTITLTVTDAENRTATTSWAINVTTNGFVFVDSKHTGAETGSITQPFRSVGSFFSSSAASNTTNIVYFRGGNYVLPAHSATQVRIEGRPFTWIGFPGERVTMDAQGRHIGAGAGIYFDSLHLRNFRDWGLYVRSNRNYMTIRRCSFRDLDTSTSVNHNQGFIFTENAGAGFYLVIQDNEFSHWRGGSAIGSLYNTKRVLIENNYIHTTLGGGSTGINNGIAPKYYTDYLFIRGNRVIMSSGTPLAWYLNSSFVDTHHVDVSFNYFRQSGSGGAVHRWNPHGSQGRLNYYRNTAVGAIHDFRSDPCGKGPFNFYDNVLIHSTNGLNRSCVSYRNNVTGSLTGNVVDASGNLTAAFSSYLGTHGHQVNFSTAPSEPAPSEPIISAPRAPSGLKIVN